MNVVAVSITQSGATLATKLPYEHVHGALGETVRRRWASVDAFVLCSAVGLAVRVVAPLLGSKSTDPAVVCVDDAGRFVVPVIGGHGAGANALTREVAAHLDAVAVVTTATDGAGVPALDALDGFAATGDVAAVTRRWLDGRPPLVRNDAAWPLPPALAALAADDDPPSGRVVVTDRLVADTEAAATVWLRPPSLVVGVGASSGAPRPEVHDLVDRALVEAELARESVVAVATIDRKRDEPAIVALGWPVQTFTADELRPVSVPTPSEVVQRAVGTPSVAEAAALRAAGPGATLVVAKQRSEHATVAVARRAVPTGHLSVVGLGPGGAPHRTAAATAAVRHADVVVGYGPYVDQCADLLTAGQVVIRSPIGSETDRCRIALGHADAGRRVALVCSGDAGVFGMASLALELAPRLGSVAVDVVPGVTAALAAAAVLGAPLGHDHAAVSLSDLLTPWSAIEARLDAVASGDFVVALYNPRSSRRTWQLDHARQVLLRYRAPETPVGVVTAAGRPGERVVRTTLGALAPDDVDMLTIVIVGASTSRWVGDHLVTPRGYQR